MRSAFGKTFTYYIFILLISSFLLSLGFIQIFRGYFYSDQKNALLNQALKISDIYTQSYTEEGFDNDYFINEIAVLDKYMDYSFIMTDKYLNIIACSKDVSNMTDKEKISQFPEYDDILDGKTVWMEGNIDDIYSQNRYILCYPTVYKDGDTTIVFISVSLRDLVTNISRVYIIVAFYIVLAAVLGFITIYWAVSRFVRPIRGLNSVAKYISKGNFEERIVIHNRMNNEIKELCESFNVMAENLDSLEKRRKEIISNISHDLRSPITSIKGFIQAMLDGTIDSDRYEHYMEIIYDETVRLEKLSNSILTLTRVDNDVNDLNITDFDINKVIDETVNLIRVRAEDKNIQIYIIKSQKELYVKGDIDKIRRIINNLLDNALKFTEKGSITISVETKDDKAYISVKDTGIGLTEEEQSRVFERLYKADASRGIDKSGSGLGLSIVREFIKIHNQTITVKSKKGEGSQFTFTLDLVK